MRYKWSEYISTVFADFALSGAYNFLRRSKVYIIRCMHFDNNMKEINNFLQASPQQILNWIY